MPTVHGHTTNTSMSRTYVTWALMKNRCRNPSADNYGRYGGRGISVCDSWTKFANFLADMGERPEGMTLDRIDNNGDYKKENCRWASAKQQQRNMRTTAFFEYKGSLVSLSELAEDVGINKQTLSYRLSAGWPFALAIGTKPTHANRYLVKKT